MMHDALLSLCVGAYALIPVAYTHDSNSGGCQSSLEFVFYRKKRNEKKKKSLNVTYINSYPIRCQAHTGRAYNYENG